MQYVKPTRPALCLDSKVLQNKYCVIYSIQDKRLKNKRWLFAVGWGVCLLTGRKEGKAASMRTRKKENNFIDKLPF